jgi:cholesterol transport system auxiliary component
MIRGVQMFGASQVRERPALAALWGTLVLAGCTSLGTVAPAPQILDVGTASEATAALPPRTPIVVPPVEAAPLLRGDGVIWREKHSQQPQAYASFQWASPPADLFAQRLRDRLSVEGPVVQNNLSGSLPEVRVSLERFEQVFDPSAATSGSPASSGDIALRVVLLQNGKILDQLRLAYSIPAASGDAPGGARALRGAVDAAAESIAQWLSQQPHLRAGAAARQR